MVRAHVKQTPEEKESQKKKTPSKKKNAETGTWPCKINGCNKVFAREADLKRHQRTTKSHSVPSFACPQCDATFTRTDALRRHQKSRHNGVVIDPSQTNKDKVETDGAADSPHSKISSRAGTPDKAGHEPSSPTSRNTPKDEPSPKASSSYYRQHTMHPSYGASRPPLPPPPAPPPILYDPHYPPPIAMPTSAARLHPWSPVPPPWHPSSPASASVPAEGSPAPPPPPALPPPPPTGAMYRVPPQYYPYYHPHAPMFPYPPPPEYLAHYGMMHPGMPMQPYMHAAMPGPPPPPPQPVASAGTSPTSATASSPSPGREAELNDGQGTESTASPVEVVPASVIDPALSSSISETQLTGSSGHTAKEQETATLEAAKVAVEVLLKYQSEKSKEDSVGILSGSRKPEESELAQPVNSIQDTQESLPKAGQLSSEPHISATLTDADPESTETEELPMLNADELLTQESLASPPPPA